MKKKSHYSLFVIFFFLIALMSLPKPFHETLRDTFISFFTPSWQKLLSLGNFFSSKTSLKESLSAENLNKLYIENTRLKTELVHLKELIQHELKLLSTYSPDSEVEPFLKKRHALEFQKLSKSQLHSVPARVIYRSPASWSSSLWIDVGKATNQTLGSSIIVKNSPVLIGTSIVGVLDYVGENQSRVRLITDSGLTPSVRVVRCHSQNALIAEKMFALIRLLEKEDEILDHQEKQELLAKMEKVAKKIGEEEAPLTFLAKGELHGSNQPLWRSQRQLLKGTGFNYDFADQYGPARDLRTGIPEEDLLKNARKIPMIQKGDTLVTTGLDGVFPPDLLVAEVTKVHPLKEGDYFYELEAIPSAGDLDTLSLLFVISPVGYDKTDQPSPFEYP